MSSHDSGILESTSRRHRTSNDRKKKKRSSTDERRRRKKAQPLSAEALAQLNDSNTGSSNDLPYEELRESRPRPKPEEHRTKRKRKERNEPRRDESPTRDEPRPTHESRTRRESRARYESRTRYEAVAQDDSHTHDDDRRREGGRRRDDGWRREERRREDGRRQDVSRRRSDSRRRAESLRRDESPRRDELHRDLHVDRRPRKTRRRHNDNTDDEHSHREGDGYERVEVGGHRDKKHQRQRDRRIPSGAILEEGRSRGILAGHLRGGAGGSRSSADSIEKTKDEKLYYTQSTTTDEEAKKKKKKKFLIIGGIGALVAVIVIVVAAVVASKNKHGSTSSSSNGSSSGLGSISASSIPTDAPAWLNPYKWADVTDFNLTYTNETVGGLPIMGLNTSYDDSASANDNTAALNTAWGSYGTTPARGVNLGGWLSLEPFITPSLFNKYDSSLGIIDEWTLCSYLGSAVCASTLESHYASFVTESTFAEIAAAGLDHVRIPFSYWAVAVYDDDPYLFRTSWRYLLRGIEWARRHGLRVNLDLHGLPGSQNGWNHSGRQGAIGWMNGTDGALNVQRSLDVHDQLSRFFAQERYANVISHYGLANEPRMTFLSVSEVMSWTQTAAALVRANGLSNSTIIVFGDGFCGLSRWQGQPNDENLALDVHQYEIFNNEQIVYTHEAKIQYACTDWTQQTDQSMDTSTGFGPTIVAEWSQADTDCATYLGNVGNGNRWTGTYDVGNSTLNALTPMCPAKNSTCSCTEANADVSSYSNEYKQFLLTFAEAQMYSFEKGWGWWYWTWDTEDAPQWSYKQGLAAGILPAKASQRSFNCDLSDIPSFSGLAETY